MLRYKVYSDKSIVVYGDKNKYNDILKKLGGKFYKALKDGEEPTGWLISVNKEDVVKKLIESLADSPKNVKEGEVVIEKHVEEVQKVEDDEDVQEKVEDDVDEVQEKVEQVQKKVEEVKEKVEEVQKVEKVEEVEKVDQSQKKVEKVQEKKNQTKKPVKVEIVSEDDDEEDFDTEDEETDEDDEETEDVDTEEEVNTDEEDVNTDEDKNDVTETKSETKSDNEEEVVSEPKTQQKSNPKTENVVKKDESKYVPSFYKIEDDPEERIISKTKEQFENFMSDEEETDESREIFEKYKNIFSYYKLFSEEPTDELVVKMKQMKKKLFKRA